MGFVRSVTSITGTFWFVLIGKCCWVWIKIEPQQDCGAARLCSVCTVMQSLITPSQSAAYDGLQSMAAILPLPSLPHFLVTRRLRTSAVWFYYDWWCCPKFRKEWMSQIRDGIRLCCSSERISPPRTDLCGTTTFRKNTKRCFTVVRLRCVGIQKGTKSKTGHQ